MAEMTDSEKVTRIYVEILLGMSKEDSRVELTPELDGLWDTIAAEVAQMRAEGKDFEVPAELPTVDVIPGLKQQIELERAEREAAGS